MLCFTVFSILNGFFYFLSDLRRHGTNSTHDNRTNAHRKGEDDNVKSRKGYDLNLSGIALVFVVNVPDNHDSACLDNDRLSSHPKKQYFLCNDILNAFQGCCPTYPMQPPLPSPPPQNKNLQTKQTVIGANILALPLTSEY